MTSDITKSSRHGRIIGQFGEMLVCNWLSRSGFETVIVDHTGLDIIAFDPRTKKRLGITVKSRTRRQGTENRHVNLFLKDARQKLEAACSAFGCEPWIAIYVEASDTADLYLTSLSHYDEIHKRRVTFGMSSGDRKRYEHDSQVCHMHLQLKPSNWFVRT